ncbi:MAG: endoglucanase [Phenylobacterium sp.]|uniref:tetratricopeptide repeat protein n=1 Tax=Phenylobacterium sp. TaxID=1871053 RepID=UPI002727A5FD|nr:endoglucanase [Phenylobacterium sp.]MDO8902009.1 endoglucanase [Phenylobacterium sp.]
MSLRRTLRSGVAAACILATAAPAGVLAQATAPSTAEPLEVRVAQARGFSRIEFQWRGAARMTSRQAGPILTLRFSRDANPDLTRLRVSPPRGLKTAQARHVGGVLELDLTLDEGFEARIGQADGSAFVNIAPRPEPPPATDQAPQTAAAPAAPLEPPPRRPDPVPADGVVRLDARLEGAQAVLRFPWAAPAGAAVFRRGDAVWVVFDAPARLDVSKAPRGLRQFSRMEAFRGPDYSAVRIASPQGVPVFAISEGSTWIIALGAGAQPQPALIGVRRDETGGPATLTAAVSGVTRIVRIPDPMVGDTLAVATALGPAKGLPSRREFVQMALLPSAQGLAMETFAEDITLSRQGDLVAIGRPQGLALSSANVTARRNEVPEGAPAPAGRPALVDYETWPKTGSGGFMSRYNALVTAAAEEGLDGQDAKVAARMALARFLVGTELAFEAIGVLNDVARQHPSLLGDAEFRGLRGISRVMARRYKEANADFSAPALANDPSAALWRSYLAAQTAQWPEARKEFAAGAAAYNQFPAVWRQRFARADAKAALEMGDLDGANSRIRMALTEETDALEELAVRLLQAELAEKRGQTGRALRIYQAVATAPVDYLSAPALLNATRIRFEEGAITPVQAAAAYDSLRFRWRGDATELATIRALGRLYLSQGRYREALEALRSAGQRLPDLPEALGLQADLGAAFRALFLDGLADGLEPVQALALFFDFKDLTPLGADGDMMVRRLVRRLVDVDLLNQAADLLSYQVDNRLDGVPRAQVATDLALIYLMDRRPEQALVTINGTRSTILPQQLNADRRLIEARALSDLGRLDHALEVLERDDTAEARDLRAEIVWRQKDWPSAGRLFEASLGDRWRNEAALSAEDEGKLLRAGVAFSLAGDDAALARMEERYARFLDDARNPEALRVALTGVASGPIGVGEFGRLTADNEAFAGWVARMKDKFRAAAAPAAQAAANPAAAAKPA